MRRNGCRCSHRTLYMRTAPPAYTPGTAARRRIRKRVWTPFEEGRWRDHAHTEGKARMTSLQRRIPTRPTKPHSLSSTGRAKLGAPGGSSSAATLANFEFIKASLMRIRQASVTLRLAPGIQSALAITRGHDKVVVANCESLADGKFTPQGHEATLFSTPKSVDRRRGTTRSRPTGRWASQKEYPGDDCRQKIQ